MEQNYYKVSYVIEGGEFQGQIVNREEEPQVGDEVCLNGAIFEIVKVTELIAPRDDFGFVHATCRYLRDVE